MSIFYRLAYMVIIMAYAATGFANALLNPNIENNEYYSETFTIFADLQNGAYIYGQIGVSNIGPGNKRGLCRILIVPPEGEYINESIIVDEDQWAYSAAKNEILKVKQCQLELSVNSKQFHFSGVINQQQIKITLLSLPIKHKTPNNRLARQSGFYESDVLIPWAKANVQYSIDGRIITETGYGYADHSRSTLLPATIANQWVRFRSLNSTNSQVILARQDKADNGFEGWIWGEADKEKSEFGQLRLAENNAKNELHWKINFQTEKGGYQISTQTKLLRYAPMEDGGILTRMLSYFIGNPVTYTYRAKLLLPNGTEQKGILEISKINGE